MAGDMRRAGTRLRSIVLLALLLLPLSGPRPAEAGFFCPNDCSGHGSCRFEGVLNPRRQGPPWGRACVCDPGWTAADCSRCDASDACPGGQVCRFGECRCPIGWLGDDCNRCYSSVACGAHGSCYEEKCVCAPGWSGPVCDVPLAGAEEDDDAR